MKRCPSCNSPIYSRKRIYCGVCGEKLPSELLLTEEQRRAIDEINKDCRENHEDFMTRMEERESVYEGMTTNDGEGDARLFESIAQALASKYAQEGRVADESLVDVPSQQYIGELIKKIKHSELPVEFEEDTDA